MKLIGKNIRERRKLLGIKQADLAKAIGVTQSFVSMIESGTNNPTMKVLREIAHVLDTSLDELTTNHDYDRYGEETLRELEAMFVDHQYHDMMRLIQFASGAEYFQNHHHRNRILFWKAVAYTNLFEYADAVEICLHLLDKLESTADDALRSAVHSVLAKNYLHLDDMVLARKHGEKAREYITHLTATDQTKRLSRSVLINLGMVYTHMSKFDDAMRYLEQASNVIDQDISAQVRENAKILFSIASVAFLQEKYDDALKYAFNALRHYRFIDDVCGQIETMNNIAYVSKLTGNKQQSAEYFELAAELAREHPDSVTPNARKELTDEGYDV